MQSHFIIARKVTALFIVMALAILLTSCVPVENQQAKYKWKAITNLSNAGDLDAAIAEGHKLLKSNPNDPGTLYWLADAYKAKGEKAEAEKLYLKIVSDSVTYDASFFSGAHINLGWMYKSDKGKALGHLEQALKVMPMMRDALVPRNNIYLYQGRYREALAGFEHLLSNPGISDTNILNFNQKFEGYRGKAFALLGLGEVEAAKAVLNETESSNTYSAEWDRVLFDYATGNIAKIKSVYVKQGWLGTEFKDYVTADGRKGVEIIRVFDGSPAERAGFLKDDVILQVGERTFDSQQEFASTIKSYQAGQTVPLLMLRGGQSRTIDVVLGSYIDTVIEWAGRQPEIIPILAQNDTLSRADKEITDGNLRQALQICLDHLWVSAPGSEQRPIMKKVMSIVRRLDPPPAIPEEAVRHAARAEAYLKSATDINGTNKAYEEFEAALRLAPWWADAWFNLGIAQKTAGDPASAIESLQMFLLTAPNDPAAPQVQREIYSLEVEAENPYQWRGQWSDGTSLYHLQRDGDQASVIFVNPDSIDAKLGFRAGDLHFSGSISGNRLTGKRVFHGESENVKKCFGETFDRDTTVEMGDNGYTLTAQWQSSTFQIKSCEITALEEQTRKYYRLP